VRRKTYQIGHHASYIAGGFGQCTHDQDTMVLSGVTLAFDRLSAERLRSCLNYVLQIIPIDFWLTVTQKVTSLSDNGWHVHD